MPPQPSFALSGCGRIAARHADEILKHGILSAVCDPDEHRAADFAERFHCPQFVSPTEMFNLQEPPDVLVICSPNGLHAGQALEGLAQGCHILCEKPFTLTSPDCRQAIEAANRAGRLLYVVQSYRHNAAVKIIHEAICAGRLGKITAFQLNCFWNRDDKYYTGGWKGSLEMDGGLLFTQFSHFMDLLHWFFGEPVRIQGFTRNFAHIQSIAFEDMGAALLEFDSGVSGSLQYTINAFHKNMEGALTIFGDRGTVRIGGEYCNRIEYQQVAGEPLSLPPATYPSSNHPLIYQDFMGLLQEGKWNEGNAQDALKTVELIEKIYSVSGR